MLSLLFSGLADAYTREPVCTELETLPLTLRPANVLPRLQAPHGLPALPLLLTAPEIAAGGAFLQRTPARDELELKAEAKLEQEDDVCCAAPRVVPASSSNAIARPKSTRGEFAMDLRKQQLADSATMCPGEAVIGAGDDPSE